MYLAVKNNRRGFTLLELLVVIAIIGILSSVVLASLNSSRERSRDARRMEDLNQIRTALEIYHTANGSFVRNLQDLVDAGILLELPSDPQQGHTNYSYRPSGNPVSGYCLGATLEQPQPSPSPCTTAAGNYRLSP